MDDQAEPRRKGKGCKFKNPRKERRCVWLECCVLGNAARMVGRKQAEFDSFNEGFGF